LLESAVAAPQATMAGRPLITPPREIAAAFRKLLSIVLPSVCYLSPVIAGTVIVPDFKRPIPGQWSFEYGVSLITSNNIGEIFSGTIHVDDGPAGGEIHQFTASLLLAEPEWTIFGKAFRPALEMPLTLALFDENDRSPFLDYNVSFFVRWRDFPWNNHVLTSFGTGVGLSYTDKVPAMDIQRHPDEDRSHLKFNWPIQLTLARPDHPEHQIFLFIAHQSGGKFFDTGGINSIGIGYRFARW